MHTTLSDGALSPLEVIDLAHQQNVSAISITDHDTAGAYHQPEVSALADHLGIELVPGIEISTFHTSEVGLHVLGYYIDPSNPDITALPKRVGKIRRNYAETVAERLRGSGWSLDPDLLDVEVPTKATIADVVINDEQNKAKLLTTFGELPLRGQFIEALMNPGGKYFVERPMMRPDEAIDIIHGSGGVAVLAHPVALMYERNLDANNIRDLLVQYEFDGLEAIYYYFAKSRGDVLVDATKVFTDMANEEGLLISGGSDFHGHEGNIGNYLNLGLTTTEADITLRPNQATLQAIEQAAKRH